MNRKLISYLMFVFLIISINGCTERKYHVEPYRFDNYEKQEESGADREVAIERYGYTGKGDLIHIYSPIITPNDIRMGETINFKCEYVLLSPIKNKIFPIEEIITISSKKERFDLAKRNTRKTQGLHIININIILPMDLNPGQYHIITSITSGRIKNTAKAGLLIRR